MLSNMKNLKIEGHPDLMRDTSSHAVINNNLDDYQTYMKTYKHRQSEKDRLSSFESDLKSLKTEINEIKNLLINLNKQ